jgi:hypothetical protein
MSADDSAPYPFETAWAAYDIAVIAHQRAELSLQLARSAPAGKLSAATLADLQSAVEQANQIRSDCLASLVQRPSSAP